MILAAWYHPILAFFFGVLAVLLMIVILLQRGKGVGLAGAFGGTPAGTAFGAKTGDVLTWVTITGAVLLLLFTVVLNFVFVPSGPGITATGAAPGATDTGGAVPPPAGEEGAWYPSDEVPSPRYALRSVFGDGA